MHWRRIASVQLVGALLARGPGCVERTLSQLRQKSILFQSLDVESGEDWIVVFAAFLARDSEPVRILPSLPDTIPLYEEATGWWLPVGVALGVPAHAKDALREALSADNRIVPPMIIVPRFLADAQSADQADIYTVQNPRPYGGGRMGAPRTALVQ
jgi:hypothetical protein